MKQLQPDSWETFFRTYKVGDIVKGKVCRTAAFGVFVELMPGVEGLCHRSEIADEAARRGAKTPFADEPALPLGEEMNFKIIKTNEAQKRIGLSIKAISEEDEQNRLLDYKRQAVVATSTVGDVIRQHQSDDKPDR